ncbi:hypothetical protein [Devosia sp. 2618]|uniref:hypothetical protein n=1 Tax=Devosia sp. 2618 TaxID=3156454 RepID=UPI0033959095
MSKPETVRIVTYHSTNAEARKSWLAFIVEANGAYLPVRFQSDTEEAAKALAQEEWDRHSAEREANQARREEGRRKAAETLARKASVSTAHKINSEE